MMFYFIEKRVSHKKWRAFVKAERRRKKRTEIAQKTALEEETKLTILMSDPSYRALIEEQERLEEEALRIEEVAAQKRREEWLERDLVLHTLWLKKKETTQKAFEELKRKEELLKKEWEENIRKEEDEKLKKQEEKEALLRKATSGLGSDMTHNPEPPQGHSRKYKEVAVEPCPFFNKTGACRYGPSCSREHKYPTTSRTILLMNMYSHIGLDGELIDDYDTDISLEYSESERYNHYREFYYDVLPEFEKCGRVIQFKVCCNKSPHLRGNVYVQYTQVENAEKAVRKFNGRWYAGRQISCIFVPVDKWKSAICGLHWSHKCPKGNLCNFLHVYRNPGNAFYNVDVDYLERKNHQNYSRFHANSSQREGPNSSETDPNSSQREDYKTKDSRSLPKQSTSRNFVAKAENKNHLRRESRHDLHRDKFRRSRNRSKEHRNHSHRSRERRKKRKASRSRSRSREKNKENKGKGKKKKKAT